MKIVAHREYLNSIYCHTIMFILSKLMKEIERSKKGIKHYWPKFLGSYRRLKDRRIIFNENSDNYKINKSVL